MRITKSYGTICTCKASKQASRLALGLVIALFAVSACSQLGMADTYALVVGIGIYESGIPTEIRADIDAQEMAIAFERAGIENIDTLINENATQNAILNWFDVAEMHVSTGDTIFLYFAGHGGLVSDITGREAESAAFFPYDADGSGGVATDHAITDEELGNLVIRSLRNCNVVVFIDACHSGGLMREGTDSPLVSRGEGVARGLLTAVRERKDNGRTLFLSSSREFEQSWEYPGQTPAGIFTSFLVEAMTCADTDLNGEITFGELATYVGEGVEEFVINQEGTYQRPVSGASPEGTESNAFPLFNTPNECRVVQRIDGSASIATSVAAEAIDIPDPALESAIRARLHGYAGLITKDLAERITTLDAPSSEIRSLEGLQAFSNLERLDLRGNEIQDLSPLAQMDLKTLKISFNEVTSLDALENSTSMRYLDAGSNPLNGIAVLAKMPRLRYLYLGNSQISIITPLSGSCEMIELDLSNNTIKNIDSLQCMKNLETLRLNFNQIVDIRPLMSLKELRNLHMWQNDISNVTPLAGLTKLAILDLSLNSIVDISPLAKMTSLESLWLITNEIVDISPLAGLEKLTNLDLGNNRIVNISSLASLTNLEQLDLWENEVVNITPVAHLTKLRVLSLAYNKFAKIDILGSLVDLEQLMLFGNDIVDISTLANLTNLTYLILFKNEIADISPLAGLTNLKWLDVSQNQIVNIGSLANMSMLEHFDASLNKIVDVSPLGNLTRLKLLRLVGNNITDIQVLVDMAGLIAGDDVHLAYNSLDLTPGRADFRNIQVLINRGVHVQYTPQHVDPLSVISISDPGLDAAIREVTHTWGEILVKDMDRRTILDASERNISNLEGIEYCIDLTRLSLYGNHIEDINPLGGLTALHYLNLQHNQIDNIGALTGLTQLAYLDLMDNRIDDLEPLIANLGLGPGDIVDIRNNNLNIAPGTPDMLDIQALQDRCVEVYYTMVAYPAVDTAGNFTDPELGTAVYDTVNELEDSLYASLTRDDIEDAAGTLSPCTIISSHDDSNEMPNGTILIFRTSKGNLGKALIVDNTKRWSMTFKYVIFAIAGSVLYESSGSSVRNTWTFDFETDTEGTPGSDFWWQHENYPGPIYLNPENGAVFAVYREGI